MLNISTLFFFVFVFTILVVIRNTFKFMGALLQKEPQPVVMSNGELIFLGLSISYIITYLYFN